MKPYIKKVEIRNYKTHKNTRILLGDGVNSIVGPNGVGKSNILEAIIFGLGERSPKNLRVSSFTEIVYNNRKDIDVSVTLTIVDKYGNEHRFKRVYDPSKGEHKYRYNGRRVSRTSYIINLMKLGGKGFKYVYIQQGDILNRANATPQDIREIVDEALGIKQYEEKKKDALKKLEEADIKLRTLEGKYSEVQRFMREYMKEMINFHTLENLIYLENLLKSAKATYERRRKISDLEKLSEKRVLLKNRILKINDRLEKINDRLADIKKKLNLIDAEIEKLEDEKYKSLYEEKEKVRRKRDELTRQLLEESSEIKRLSRLIEDKKKEIDIIKTRIIEDKEDIKTRINTLKDIRKERKNTEREIEKRREELKEIDEKITDLNNRWKGELDQITNNLEEVARSIANSMLNKLIEEDTKKEIELVKRRVKRIDELMKLLNERLDEIDKRLTTQKMDIKEKRKTILKYRRTVKKLKREINDAEKLLKRLDRLIEGMKKEKNIVRDYYLESKKLFETVTTLRINGLVGILGELVKGPNEIITLLREVNPILWFGIIVTDEKAAREVLRVSRELGKNVSLLILSDYKNVDEKIHEKSVLNILKYPKRIEPILRKLIGNILIISSDDELMDAISKEYSVIHITGDYVIGKGVWFRARRSRIHIPRNIDKVNEVREKFAVMIHKRKKMLDEKRKELEKLRLEYTEGLNRIALLTQNKKFLITQIKYFKEWKEDLSTKLKDLEKRVRKESKKEEKKKKSIIEQLRKELDILKEKRKNKMEILEDLENHLKKLSKAEIEIETAISKYKEINAERKSRIDSLRNEINGLKKDRDARKNNLKTIASQLKKVIDEYNEIVDRERRIDEIISKFKERRERLRNKYEKGERLEKKYSDIKRKNEKILLSLEYKIKDIQKQINELNDIIEELGVGERALEKPEYIEEVLEELKKEEEVIGGASKYSEDRYYAHIDSYKMYSIRRNEILKERESILKFIDEIDREKERVFWEGFNKIRERFSAMFNEVFPGSKASIELIDPEDIDSDIQIYIEFKEKPTLPISALSGGEKTAIIILFLLSVYSINEDTVFLLDEIDAHLDIRNVENVAKVIRSQRKYSQIILVTLPGHDSMVTIADYVIPVVFRRGTSKVFQMSREHLEGMIRP